MAYSPLTYAAKDEPSTQHFAQSSTEYTVSCKHSWVLAAHASTNNWEVGSYTE